MPEEPKTVDPTQSAKKVLIYSRIFGVFFLGIFVLGIAMSIGDLSTTYHSPISGLSTSTTLFGLFGLLISEISARRAQGWIEKSNKAQ